MPSAPATWAPTGAGGSAVASPDDVAAQPRLHHVRRPCLYDDPANAHIVAELTVELARLQGAVGDRPHEGAKRLAGRPDERPERWKRPLTAGVGRGLA